MTSLNQAGRSPLEILQNNFNISKASFLAKGMESSVFDIGNNRVAKLYKKEPHTPDFHKLSNFYHTLDTSKVTFSVPQILDVQEEDEYILVIEAKYTGRALTVAALQTLSIQELKDFVLNYTETLCSVRRLKSDSIAEAETFTGESQFFSSDAADWRVLVLQSLESKENVAGKAFSEDVVAYYGKYHHLRAFFQTHTFTKAEIIHGDFFPGNLLVDNKGAIKYVLDFGTLTTKGDYLFDLATGWQFIDMYGEITKIDLKKLVYDSISNRLSSEEQNALRAYILFYSLISFNMYSHSRKDGHYLWCVNNWNNEDLWEKLSYRI